MLDQHKPFMVVVPVMDTAAVEEILPIAAALARARNGWILLLGVVPIIPHKPVSAAQIKQQRDMLSQFHETADAPLLTAVRVACSWQEGISNIMEETRADLLLVGCGGAALVPDMMFDLPPKHELTESICDW